MTFKIYIRYFKLLVLGLCIGITPSHALEGGQPVNASDYPGLVILSYRKPDDLLDVPRFPDDENCTGVVLQARRVLTSLECVLVVYFGFGILPLPEIWPMPASSIQIHPVINGEIVGIDTLPPVIKPSQVPNVSVSAIEIHPRASIGLSRTTNSYGLAILYLTSDIGIETAVLYDGTNKFTDFSAMALGWQKFERAVNAEPVNSFVLRKLEFDLVDGDTNADSDCREYNDTYTATVFCGGYRNATNYLEPSDKGSPIYRIINKKQVVIGILMNSSGTSDFYERYTRISTMTGFIKHHAPDARFESGARTNPLSDFQILLLD